VRDKFRVIRKAVFTLAVGMAFFLFACQVKTIIERVPEGKKPVLDLYDTAKQYYQAEQYEDALTAFTRILTEYPDHPVVPSVKNGIASTYYRMGDFHNSLAEALEWLEMYPDDPLKGEILVLIGNNYSALGDGSEAFRWWLEAENAAAAGYQLGDQQKDIDDMIIDLINRSPAGQLKEMAEYGSESIYIPNIYQRLAMIYLEENSLDNARDFAMLLVRSSKEQHWVDIGREILDKTYQDIGKGKVGIRGIGVIGCLLPLSGPYALYGQEILNGIQLGMDLFNKSESDQDLELVIRDTKGSVEDAINGVEELVQRENAVAIIGPLASEPATAAVKKAQELGVPIISFTQKEGITSEGDMVFRNFLTPSKEVEAVLNKALIDMGMKRFGIFYPDNAYGRFFMNLFWDRIEEMGGTITAVESYKADDTDFATGIKKMVGLYYPRPESVVRMLEIKKTLEALKEMGYGYYWGYWPWNITDVEEEPRNIFEQEAEVGQWDNAKNMTEQEEDEEPEPIVDFDAVFIPDSHQQVALIAPQFPFYNVFNVPFLGTSLWMSDELLETARGYVQGAIFPSGFFIGHDSEIVVEFVKAYKENFEANPTVLAANGYDTVRLIKDILRSNVIRTGIDFQKAILEHDTFNGVTGEISFDDQGEVEKDPVLLTVYGRRFHLLHSSP